MQKGYYRKVEAESKKTATILAAIRNTHSAKMGNVPFTADDFLTSKETAQISPDEQRELARQALENSKRFEKGVVYETLD